MENNHDHGTEPARRGISPVWMWACIAAAVALVVAVAVFKVPVGTVASAAVFLACPLMHIAMMRGGDHKH